MALKLRVVNIENKETYEHIRIYIFTTFICVSIHL